MWFRALVLIIFWIVLYRFIRGLIRYLAAPASRSEGRRTPPASPEKASSARAAVPADVIDVKFQELPAATEPAPGDGVEERRQAGR